MVVLSFNLKIKKPVKRAAKPDFTWLTKELNAPAFNQAYKSAKPVAESPAEITVSQSLKSISTSLLAAVNTVVPASKRAKTKRRERSDRTIQLFDARARKLQSLQEFSPEFRLQKKLYQKEIANSCRDDYRAWVEGITQGMEEADDKGDNRAVQAGVHLLSGKKKFGTFKQPGRNSDGKSLALPGDLLAEWQKFCGKKFGWSHRECDRPAAPPLPPAHLRKGDIPPDEELEMCLKCLKAQRAVGHDGVPIEAFRASEEAKADLFALTRRMWSEEDIPEDLVLCDLISIFKKGDPDLMTNYRMLGLLTHVYKFFSTLLTKRLLEDVEDFLPKSQSGFRKLRSTRDNILLLAKLMDSVLENEQECVITFIDFVAAFDSVSHKFLDSALFEAGASDKSRAIFRAIYEKASARMRIRTAAGETQYSDTFAVNRGVIQGDIVSPLCFIVALEAIMRKHGGSGTQTAFGILIDRLEYADDAALIDADSAAASDRVSRLCAGARSDADMEISAPKSEILFCRPRVKTAPIVPQDYADLDLKHKCKFCGRGFDTTGGRNIHQGTCKRACEEYFEEEFEVEGLADVRGPPDHRFYLVMWKGYTEGTWTAAADFANPLNWDARYAKQLITEFWGDTGLENCTIPDGALSQLCVLEFQVQDRCSS